MYPGLLFANTFGIFADLAMNIASATNSSPQTTELFGAQRATTLWKWVKIGGGVAIAYGLFASIIGHSLIPILAVGTVIIAMGLMYHLALKWGKDSNGVETPEN